MYIEFKLPVAAYTSKSAAMWIVEDLAKFSAQIRCGYAVETYRSSRRHCLRVDFDDQRAYPLFALQWQGYEVWQLKQ